MGQRVEHRISDSGISLVGIEFSGIAPPSMTSEQIVVPRLYRLARLPLLNLGFVEGDEDPFAMDLGRGHPCGSGFTQCRPGRAVCRVCRLLGRFDAREAEQRVYLAKALQKKDAHDLFLERLWCLHSLAQKMGPVGRWVRVSQHLPFRLLNVGGGDSRSSGASFDR